MSQSWGSPPNRPPSRPSQPEYQLIIPEDEYYPPESPVKRAWYFIAGGCSTLALVGTGALLVGACVCAIALLWVVDSQLDRFDAIQGADGDVSGVATEQASINGQGTATALPPIPTPTVPGPAGPVAIGQPIVANDIGLELTVFDIQRSVQPNNFQAADGLEFVSVSVQLRNINGTASLPYQVVNFRLRDSEDVYFSPDLQADNGRRLNDGEVLQQNIIEGDLLFHIPLGEAPLTLVWQAAGSQELHTVELQ